MGKIDPKDQRSRCQLVSRLSRAYSHLGDSKNSAKCHKEGVNLARRLGDKTSLFELSVVSFLTQTTVKSVAEANDRIARVDELKRLSAGINDDDARSRALAVDVYVSTELGNRARADRAVDGWKNLGRCASVSTSYGSLGLRGP